MRFVPLIPSSSAATSWAAFKDVELRWDGGLHTGWEGLARSGLAVHALHLPLAPWGDALLAMALEALRPRLGADFLVLRAEDPSGRLASSAFLQTLEALLEHTSGRGVKLALRPAKGALGGLLARLKEARGEAVGFCWDSDIGPDLELISDRLYTAVGGADEDYAALQRTGYRWNLALEGRPDELSSTISALERKYPPVFFPAEMPTTALGRPIVPDASLVFGAHWDARPDRRSQ
ncbi:MAG: hypothetical protein KGN80_00790 [Acidobacteriota bacterium]|nr:hypothetical protein [Acidobacteriota bacterium]